MKNSLWQRALLAACWAAFMAACLAGGAQPVLAQDASAAAVVADTDGGDHFLAGCPVKVTAPVTGNVVAAGCHVDVLAPISGDLIVLGGDLKLSAPVKQDLFAAGGDVSIESSVGGNVRIGGGHVKFAPTAKVGGNVSVAGGDVTVDGAIDGSLKVTGGRAHINGLVSGDVEAGAGEVELGPDARIKGKLRYSSADEIKRDIASEVTGGTERLDQSDKWDHWDSWDNWGSSHHDWRDGWHDKWRAQRHGGHGWGWSLGLLVIAGVMAAALPSFSKSTADTVHTRWAMTMLIGFIAMVCAPVLAVLAVVTLIGIPLGILIMVLYFALLLFGYVFSGIALGRVGLQQWGSQRAADPGWQILAAVLGMLAVTLLAHMPFIGWMFWLIAMVTGIGVLLMQVQSLRTRPAAPAV